MIFDALSKHQSRTLSMNEFKEYISRNGGGGSSLMEISSEDATPFSCLQPLPTLKEAGSLLVQEALHRAQGNQTIAARMLGITRQALGWRLKQEMEQRVGSTITS